MVSVVQNKTAAERFWPKVDKSGECWLWTGYIKPNGYATFYPGGGRHVDKIYVHRFAFEATRGPIPDGMELDHLCRVRHCVNPGHLEPVTRRENLDRRNEALGWQRLKAPGPRLLKQECKRGHTFDAANTYWWNGYRLCRTCRREHARNRDARARKRVA